MAYCPSWLLEISLLFPPESSWMVKWKIYVFRYIFVLKYLESNKWFMEWCLSVFTVLYNQNKLDRFQSNVCHISEYLIKYCLNLTSNDLNTTYWSPYFPPPPSNKKKYKKICPGLLLKNFMTQTRVLNRKSKHCMAQEIASCRIYIKLIILTRFDIIITFL